MKQLMLTCTLTFIAHMSFATCPVALSNVPNEEAKKLAISKLGQFLKCDPNDPKNDDSPCNTFAARGLEAIYAIKDFSAPNGYFSANAIADFVAKSADWVEVGNVYDESNNLCAQSLANRGFAVIAIQKKVMDQKNSTGEKQVAHGHVGLIIPGEPKDSQTWKFKAANSAAFRLRDVDDPNSPGDAYVNGLLSKTFGVDNAKKAKFYYRKVEFQPEQK